MDLPQQVCQSGIDTGHSNTQQDPQRDHLAPSLHERSAKRDNTKAHRDEREPDTGSERPDSDRRRQLKRYTRNREDKDRDRVAVADVELQVRQHGRNGRRGDDAAIEQVQTAENACDGTQAQVDFESDSVPPFLFKFCAGGEDGGIVGVAMHLVYRLFLRGLAGCSFRHGSVGVLPAFHTGRYGRR